MKKFIIKKIREDCYLDSAHPCYSSSVKSNLIFLFPIALLLSCSTFYGQLVGSSTVKANFGVEGDAYANTLQFPNVEVPPVALPNPAGTDDWFTNSAPGTGVIDQANTANWNSLILSNNRNYSFEVRQSNTTPSLPFPYPIVLGNGIPYLWIDSVYGRDHQTGQGRQDSSRFDQTSDKNADNPSTWNLGI
ncbi:MAG: hypothetical protein KBC56_07835 [Flavobacterium sp.]|nr:hypothetical protein [Flavobacterium sp.]